MAVNCLEPSTVFYVAALGVVCFILAFFSGLSLLAAPLFKIWCGSDRAL